MKIETRLKREGRICYKKGEEKGLWFERQCLQDVIASKTAKKEDCKFEKDLLKQWSKYTEADYSSGWE